MSIIYTFKKLVDPMTARAEDAERQRKREQPKQEAEGDPPLCRCRVCGLEATERSYCPACLADTMEPVVRRPAPPADGAPPADDADEP